MGYGFYRGMVGRHEALWHAGGWPGWSSQLVLIPEVGLGYFVAVNTDAAAFMEALLEWFAAEVLGGSLPPPTAGSPDGPLDRYAGTYRLARHAHRGSDKLAVLAGLPMPDLHVKTQGDSALVVAAGQTRDRLYSMGVEQGRVDLDAPVEQYLGEWELPESRFEEREVTVRRLLSNSAGAALGTVGEEYRPRGEGPPLRTYLSREVRLAYKPGSEFRYSNAGFNLLELLVEEKPLIPIDARRFRGREESLASVVFTGGGGDARLALGYGTPLSGNYRRVSAGEAWARWGLAGASVLLLVSPLLFALYWIPAWRFAASARPEPLTVRLLPLVASLAFVGGAGLIVLGASDPIYNLGQPTVCSVGYFVLSLVFSGATIGSTVELIRHRRAISREHRIYQGLVVAAGLIVFAYLAVHGMIGYRFWT
jgi:hypothetical protein